MIKTKDSINLKQQILNANNTLRILITKKCNSKCIYCYEEGIFNSTNNQDQNLDLNDFKKIILVGQSLGVSRVSISGGEPMLYYKWVEEIAKLCVKQNIFVTITSNGTYPCIIDLAKKYPSIEFRISLDCSTKKEYNYFRGIDKFDVVINTIKKLAKVSNKVHINRVVYTLDNEWREFEKMIKFLISKKLNKKNVYLKLLPAYPSSNFKELSPSKYKQFIFKKIPEFRSKYDPIRLRYINEFNYKNVNIIFQDRGVFSSKCCPINKTRCPEGIGSTRINPNGVIQPCYGIKLNKINHNDTEKAIKTKLKASRKFLDSLC